MTLTLDINKVTLGAVVNRILRNDVGFNQPQLLRNDEYDPVCGCVVFFFLRPFTTFCAIFESFIYECGDGLSKDEVARYEALAQKPLAQLAILNGSMLAVDDFSQDLRVQLIVAHR